VRRVCGGQSSGGGLLEDLWLSESVRWGGGWELIKNIGRYNDNYIWGLNQVGVTANETW